jgi:mannosyltransferase
MAIARPVRVLAMLAIVLWVFFFSQVWRPEWRPEKYPLGPGDTLKNVERDPNLDRTFSIPSARRPLTAPSDW